MKFDSFELDPEAYVLKKSGYAVKLERIPMELLLLLSASRGRLITREEIVTHIWGKDRFLDSESAVNTAMRKLRNALGEDPEHPKYIETVPRRGYRFIADVADLPRHPSTPNGSGGAANGSTGAPNGPISHSNGSISVPTAVVATQHPEVAAGPVPKLQERNRHPAIAPTHSSSRRRTLKWALPVAGVAVLLLIALAVWISRPRLPVVTNAVRITDDGKPKSFWNLPVTDGVRLYFVEGHPETTGSRIAQLSTSGGETTWITTAIPAPEAIYDISADGSELLVGNSTKSLDLDELWVQPLPAGAPHRVGNILASAASWTPDSKHIAYADGRAITIANLDGSDPRELLKVPQTVFSIRFSPDGRRIRLHVVNVPASASSIWEMNADGTNLHQMFSDWNEAAANVCCGNWSPDGNFYYFRAGRGHAQSVWVKSERRPIFGIGAPAPGTLMSGLLRFSCPVPSRDGKKLFVFGEEPRVELFRYDQQGQRFDPYLSGLSAGPIDFSRDRKWIAYVTYPDATLWRSRIDGSEKMQLTFPPLRAYEPRWSPDGSKIAFMDVRYNRPWKMNLISSTGGNPQALLPAGADQAEADPTWTPDGEFIVFGEKGIDNSNPAIYRLHLKSGQVSLIPGTQGLFSPRLSPDGRYIAAFNQDATALVLFDTTTNQRSTLATGEQLGSNEWSSDGQYVYMRYENRGTPELVRVKVKDRALEQVLNLKDFPQSNDLFALWVGLTPDDAPLLMRDRSIQEIYALDLRFR